MSSSAEDLTARARIRDAAIALFADRGIGPATIRDIAQAAGVSPGVDPRAHAAVLVAMQMGMFPMADQLSAALGTDVTKPAGHLRMMAGAIDVFTHPLPADHEAAARAVLDKLTAETLEEGTP